MLLLRGMFYALLVLTMVETRAEDMATVGVSPWGETDEIGRKSAYWPG